MFKKILTLGLLLLVGLSSSFGMLSEGRDEAEEPARQSTFKNLARHMAARLYYAAAVRGHSSYGPGGNGFFMVQLNAKKLLGPAVEAFTFESEDVDDTVVEAMYQRYGTPQLEKKSYKPEEWKKTRTFLGYKMASEEQVPQYFFTADMYKLVQKPEFLPDSEEGPKVVLAVPFKDMPFQLTKPVERMNFPLRELIKKFPTTPFEVHATQLEERFFTGHISYVILYINVAEGKMHTRVMDPRAKAWHYLMPAPYETSLSYHTQLAQDLGLEGTYEYHYLGNQVLNLCDCGRFSTIYMLYAFQGKDPRELTAYEIYKGFKILEENDYEVDELNWVGRVFCGAMGLVGWANRKVAELAIGALEEKEHCD